MMNKLTITIAFIILVSSSASASPLSKFDIGVGVASHFSFDDFFPDGQLTFKVGYELNDYVSISSNYISLNESTTEQQAGNVYYTKSIEGYRLGFDVEVGHPFQMTSTVIFRPYALVGYASQFGELKQNDEGEISQSNINTHGSYFGAGTRFQTYSGISFDFRADLMSLDSDKVTDPVHFKFLIGYKF